MHADAVFIAQFLALVALMAVTIEYCEMLQRRQLVRRYAMLRAEEDEPGLRGLIRFFATDHDRD